MFQVPLWVFCQTPDGSEQFEEDCTELTGRNNLAGQGKVRMLLALKNQSLWVAGGQDQCQRIVQVGALGVGVR